MKRGLSTAIMAIYWAALPVCALLMLGSGWLVLTPGVPQYPGAILPLRGTFAGSAAFTLLIVWRLWVHERARRLSAKPASEPSP